MAFEDVQIAHGVNHNKQDQQDGGTCQAQTIIGDFDVFGRENGGTNFLSKKIRRTEVPPRYVSKKKERRFDWDPLKQRVGSSQKDNMLLVPSSPIICFSGGLAIIVSRRVPFFFNSS